MLRPASGHIPVFGRDTIIPVNPNAHDTQILGEQVYSSISEVSQPIDVVNIFRPSDDCLEVVKSIVEIKIKPKLIWMQIKIQNAQAKELAEKHGIPVVMDKCLMVEHQKF